MSLAALPVVLMAACLACVSSARVDRVPEGAWGGSSASLIVEAGGAEVDLPCAHGRIEEPLALDGDGAFRGRGYWVSEGGPLPAGPENRRPAEYSGTTDGRRLTFRMAVSDPAQELGPFTVVLGDPARPSKCD